MALSLALGIGAVTSGVAAYSASNNAADAAQQAAKQQGILAQQQLGAQGEHLAFLKEQAALYAEKSDELLGMSRSTVEDAYSRIIGIINRIPSVDKLFPRAEELSRKDFDFRTAIKRENLEFILGDTGEDLREIQSFSADLANMEEGAFTGRFNKIIRSNMMGLSNYLGINDFFAREGTVDPISPYTISQDLFANEFNIAGQRIGNERWRGEQLVNINNAGLGVAAQNYSNSAGIAQMGMQASNQYYNTMMNNAGISAAADAQRSQGVAQAIGLVTQGLGSAFGMYNQNQALANQRTYYQALMSNLGTSSIGSFAPNTTSPTTSSLYSAPTSSYAVAPIGGGGVRQESVLPLGIGTPNPVLLPAP
jgi:hypothetical protein